MARDPDRIDPLLAKLSELWKKSPDQRLGQLLLNIAWHTRTFEQIWNIEDDVWERMIDEAIDHGLCT